MTDHYDVSDAEVEEALAACAAERTRGAEPLAFEAEAVNATQNRYREAFKKNLSKVGGWKKAEPQLRRVSFYLGTVARDIAAFHKSSVILGIHAKSARRLIEAECDLGATQNPPQRATRGTDEPGAKEGLVCNGLTPE
jgi:anti-sigma factor RsiW